MAIVLGVLGIICGIIGPLVAGWIGGAIGVVLGVGALLLGLKAKKENKGSGKMVTGIIAIALAILMSVVMVNGYKELKEKAIEKWPEIKTEITEDIMKKTDISEDEKQADIESLDKIDMTKVNENLGLLGFLKAFEGVSGDRLTDVIKKTSDTK